MDLAFYKQDEDFWVFIDKDGNEQYYPPQTCRYYFNGNLLTILRIHEVVPFVKKLLVTDLLKSDIPNDFYSSKKEFLMLTKHFFYGTSVLLDENGLPYSAKNPINVSNTQIVTQSEVEYDDTKNTDWTGVLRNLFDGSGGTSLYNETNNNPKILEIDFVIAIQSFQMALTSNVGTFENLVVKVKLGEQVSQTIYSKIDNIPTPFALIEVDDIVGFGGLIFEFHTENRIDLTAVSIAKYITTNSVIRGESSPGEFNNVYVTRFGRLGIDIATDIFNRLPVAPPETVSDNSLVSRYSNFLFWSAKSIGAGASLTYDKATSSNLLEVTQDGDVQINQLKLRGHYQPAKAQEYLTTGLYTQQAGVIKWVGYFDVDNYDSPTIDGTIYNGISLRISENDVSFEVWNNGVLQDAASKNGIDYPNKWNYDVLDGNGFSGITLDMDFPQISLGEIEWLGVGAKRVGFNIGGINVPVHLFEHANVVGDGVYMRTAKLPICYMIKSIGGAGSIKQICNSIISGGGQNAKGVQNSIETPTDVAILNGDTELVLGMRLKAEDFDTTVIQEAFSVVSRAKNDFTVYFCLNPVYTGTVTWTNKPNSSIQYALNNNNQVTDLGIATLIQKVSGSLNSITPQLDPALRIGKGLNDDYDELWVVVKSDDGNEIYSASINYRELI